MFVKVFNESCGKTMKRIYDAGKKVDFVVFSPPYNTNRSSARVGVEEKIKDGIQPTAKYDVYTDDKAPEEYNVWLTKVFVALDKILIKNRAVLMILSYANNSAVTGAHMISAVDYISKHSPFILVDIITWKKKTAAPNNMSKNKLTRICEFVFVFSRKDEIDTFKMNKEVVSYRKNGSKEQPIYSNFYNFVEAKNNDGPCALNKATCSSELIDKLFDMYLPQGKNQVVYNPFNGTGTIGASCVRRGASYIGSEVSAAQVEYSLERIKAEQDGKT